MDTYKINDTDKKALLDIVESVERYENEKSEIGMIIKDIYTNAAGKGYDVPALKQLVKLRKLEADQRKQQEDILVLYMAAIGME